MVDGTIGHMMEGTVGEGTVGEGTAGEGTVGVVRWIILTLFVVT